MAKQIFSLVLCLVFIAFCTVQAAEEENWWRRPFPRQTPLLPWLRPHPIFPPFRPPFPFPWAPPPRPSGGNADETSSHATTSSSEENWWLRPLPRPFPLLPWLRPHPIFRPPFPFPSAPPPRPSGGKPSEAHDNDHATTEATHNVDEYLSSLDSHSLKCLKAHQLDADCAQEIMTSFVTGSVSLSSGCCKRVHSISEDCTSVVFATFESPFFASLLKSRCDVKA